MCRLFGIHSMTKTSVHQSLIASDNALRVQSQSHKDGWGIAYYVQGVPHVMRSLKSANADEDFRHLAESIDSPTVIAHVRRATQGLLSLVNCHPFQYGPWVMAHNGDCPFFERVRGTLVAELDKEIRSHLLGTTDSEVLFALILNELKKKQLNALSSVSVKDLAYVVRFVVARIEGLYKEQGIADPPSLNLLISNGHLLLGFRLGRTLHYRISTSRAQQDDDLPTHFLICSEPVTNDDAWRSLAERQIVAVDQELHLYLDL